jgi:dTDP-glucose 4,6-dehydratase
MTNFAPDTILITGGAGFIGSNFALSLLQSKKARDAKVINLDLLTYAGNPANLKALESDDRHQLVVGDIADRALVKSLLDQHRPRAIVHFAAESHVDRSILDPTAFLRTNVEGTQHLLAGAQEYWSALPPEDRVDFRFLHISTDEVYGSLGPADPAFTEQHQYAPNSPYAASKAASDHLARAWHHTYGLPVLTTNCSNNYGPFQFPEKLIPLMILNALAGKPLPVYGDGRNVRDWLFVGDHCTALSAVLERGRIGEVYNIGGHAERNNLEVVHAICDALDELRPAATSRRSLISYVADRPGHDRRYAIDSTKIERELQWSPSVPFESGLRQTILWYLDNMGWVSNVQNGQYMQWMKTNYTERVAR